jgi:hypothetical protein
VENVITTPAVSDAAAPVSGNLSDTYYFVIEIQPFGVFSSSDSYVAKLGVFDENKNLLQSINVTQGDLLPVPQGRGSLLCAGIRRLAISGAGQAELNIHHGSVVLEKDKGTFDLPPLP